jgi:hypothetical protein
MERPIRRPDLPPDPLRDHLKTVRRGLFRLHKALIDSERAVFEQRNGALSNGQFLQALIDHPDFAWLRPFTGAIVAIDEALATREPIAEADVRAFVARAAELTLPHEGPAGEAMAEARRRDPTVAFLHSELARGITEGPAAP